MPRIRTVLILALLAAPFALRAQQPVSDRAAPLDLLSVGLAASSADGPLGDQLGGSFRSVRRIDTRGLLGLRVEGGVLLHGGENFSVPGTGGEMRLTNTMVFAGVGPQAQLPRGPVRPYAHAFAGLHYLFTRADQGGPDGDGREVEITTTYEDYAWAFGGGGGVYVPVRRGTMLDAGLTWRDGGEVTFSSFEAGFGRTETDLLVAHLGITIEM